MKSLKRFTVIAAILISPTCFGQIDGKGIICFDAHTFIDETVRGPYFGLYGYTDSIPVGYFFEAGKVYESRFTFNTDRFYIAEVSDSPTYRTTPDTIGWSKKGWGPMDFDRKTAELRNTRDARESIRYSCEVLDTKTRFEDRIQEIIRSLQADYDKKSEGNVL